MAGRQSHGSAPSKAVKGKGKTNKSKKRAQDAFAIASHQNPDRVKVRQSRLGNADDEGSRPSKRSRRGEDDEDEDEEEEPQPKKIKAKKGRFDELDIDAGSDSEGNEWKMGAVDSDDDSDLDSDAAFGESEEERFEGFTFGGSTAKSKKSKAVKQRNINLDEDSEDEDSDSELSEGDLGEDAIDLATMLDQTAESSEDEKDQKSNGRTDASSDEDDDMDSESDDESSASSMDLDDNDETDPDKIAALQRMINGLPQADPSGKKPRHEDSNEYATPSDFGISSKGKISLADLGLPAVSDPHIKRSLKLLEADSKGTKKTGKLEVPLAKRQQDRLDRAAAYDKSKETLDRWTDTVKHNRRAEHLAFPLIDHDTTSAQNNAALAPVTPAKPFNDLEATIQSILEESGLAAANGKDDEDRLRQQEYDELETKKMSLDEVRARRDQLRQARELMFREEARAKRVKKIKSKSYRKVHRKEREREERKNKELLAEGGFEPSEDEQDAQDRRRAEERMSAKHRGSKWAKATKATGRAAWDEDARDGITEMARRDEQLRKRVEGRRVRTEGDDESEVSESDSYSEDSDDDDEARTARKLEDVEGFELREDDNAPGARLANMKFMRSADAARKRESDETVARIKKDLAGEDSSEEEDPEDVGRRTFGLNSTKPKKADKPKHVSEFEEKPGSDDEEEVQIILDTPQAVKPAKQPAQKKENPFRMSGNAAAPVEAVDHEGGAWSRKPTISGAEEQSKQRRKKASGDIEELDFSQAAVIAAPANAVKKPKSRPISTLNLPSEDEDSDDNSNDVRLPFAIKDKELIKRAFAGADVVGDFEAEKKQTIEEEEEKVVDNTLPGWGNWTGDGVSKREKAKNKGRFLTKTAGIKEANRKDAKLEKVIINEKRVKKVCSFHSSHIFGDDELISMFRIQNTWRATCHIPLRPSNSTREVCGCQWAPSGLPRRHSKILRSLEFCSNRELLLLCLSLCSRFYCGVGMGI